MTGALHPKTVLIGSNRPATQADRDADIPSFISLGDAAGSVLARLGGVKDQGLAANRARSA